MKPNASLDAALLMLATSYHVAPLPEAAETITTVIPTVAKPAKAPKGKKGAKKASKDSAPKAQSNAVLPSNMPEVGTLNAEQFLLALRDCGKRVKEDTNTVTGVVTQRPIFDASMVREDSIKAIHAYCGYDAALNFGEQDASARQKAQRELRGGVTPAAAHRRGGASVAPSIQGYVAGAPDHAAKRKADLEARERHAVNERLRHLKNAADSSFVPPMLEGGVREPSPEIMASLEEERLNEIRKDLGSL